MPTLHIRKASEAPAPSRVSRAVRERQQEYEGYVTGVEANNVGDLELGPSDELRSIKVRLRRASNRLSIKLDMWDADGHVYFRREIRRGRPKKL